MWWSLRARLTGEIDRDLAGRAGRFEQYFRAESAEDPGPQLRDELEEFCQALPPGSFISISGANGFSFLVPAFSTSGGTAHHAARIPLERRNLRAGGGRASG